MAVFQGEFSMYSAGEEQVPADTLFPDNALEPGTGSSDFDLEGRYKAVGEFDIGPGSTEVDLVPYSTIGQVFTLTIVPTFTLLGDLAHANIFEDPTVDQPVATNIFSEV